MEKLFYTSQSVLTQHNGEIVEVLGKVPEEKYDKQDVGLMYRIRLENGEEIEAFADELYSIVYPSLKGIRYVFYYNKNYKKLCVLTLDRKATVENTGAPWFEAAYGNCLNKLNAKFTDKLYLVSDLSVMKKMFHEREVENQIALLEKTADYFVTRNGLFENKEKELAC